MAVKQVKNITNSGLWIHSTRVHLVLYLSLLVATPFVLVQNFLQDAIQQLSVLKIELFNFEIVIVPIIAMVLCFIALIIFRAYLSRIRLLGAVIAVVMIALAQQIADFYLDHNFYDLQQNWHYFAYAIFAYMMYRDLRSRGVSWEKIIRKTYFIALIASIFDEAFQMHMSSRVFDISDIAKDVWGVLIGLVLVCFWVEQPFFLSLSGRRFRHNKIKDYFSHPFSLLFLLIIMTFLFVIFSSLLSDFPYWKHVVAFTFCTGAVFLILFHISQYKWGKSCLLAAFSLIILVQLGSYLKFRRQNIVHNQFALTVYKGIPLPFFDFMIYPNGLFRPVDKKHSFNQGDRRFLLKQKPDIILIGSGFYGKGGKGFPKKAISQFLYNRYTQKGTQVIILDTKKACEVYNRLKREKKNVLFIIHNTC